MSEKLCARFCTRDADKIDETDIDGLRAHGLTDDEIFDVVLAAAARCFFSTCLEATGTRPDKAFAALAPELRDALTVGRPIEGTATCWSGSRGGQEPTHRTQRLRPHP